SSATGIAGSVAITCIAIITVLRILFCSLCFVNRRDGPLNIIFV
ncbi:MAG: hypothetical protein H6Q72_171, partial [Firmicutes bacterium]|nr:hypothetical protein [Bacillota bacterium]